MIHFITLHQALPDLANEAAPPEWLHLVPAGEFRGNDGRGPYRLDDPAAVIAASTKAGKLVLDENHATDLAAPKGGSAPAQGWIVEMQAREDGIWGRVDWTPPGRLLMQNRAYRGVSPAIQVEKGTGRVVAVLRASLVNSPNLPLTTLHHQQEPAVDPKKLRAALGLPENADDAAVLAAAEAARTAVATHAQQLQRIAAAAGVAKPNEAGADAIVTVLNARETGNETKLLQTVTELQAEVTLLRSDQARAKATEVVDAAIRAGKPIPAKLRDIYIDRHAKDPQGVEQELALMVSLHGGGITAPPAVAGDGDANEIALQAQQYQAEQEQRGIYVSTAQAVAYVENKKGKMA